MGVGASFPSTESVLDQPVELNLDLGVRSFGAGRGQVDDQPCQAPLRHPPPEETQLSEDAIDALTICPMPR